MSDTHHKPSQLRYSMKFTNLKTTLSALTSRQKIMHQKVISILGMHRSGTSCLAGSLQCAGVFLGEVHTHNQHNKKGNREHIYLNQLQEQVLKDNGGSWYNPPQNVEWSKNHLNRLSSIIDQFKNHSVWGFKDPRSLFTISGLQKTIDGIQFVGTFRNPISVVSSLQRRNSTIRDDVYWLNLWNKYNNRLLELWSVHKFPIINFDNNEKDYSANLDRLYSKLGLMQHSRNFIIDDKITLLSSGVVQQKPTQFFDPSLRSQVDIKTTCIPNEIRETYNKLQLIAL
jgi:hypothetical protein